MWRWLFLVTLAVMTLYTQPVQANEQFDISYSTPLGGLMKSDQWTELNVTITNHGEAFAGRLELSPINSSDRSLFGQAVQLQPDETKQIRFELPVEMLMREPNAIRLRHGDEIVQERRLTSLRTRDEGVIGVIDNSDNAFHFLTISSDEPYQGQAANNFYLQNLKADALPDRSFLLDNLDILAVGNSNETIRDNQALAVKEWVKRGGVLILAGNPNQPAMAPFQDILPSETANRQPESPIQQIAELSGVSQPPFSSVPVYQADQPLFLVNKLGSGLVVRVNYDVTAEPIASWQYNRQLWQQVLQTYQVTHALEQKMNGVSLNYSLTQLSSKLPDVNPPSVKVIIVIWLIYLLLIAPVLYLVLKRIGRREWAWGIIPLAAILMTAGVYLIGRQLVVKDNTSYTVSKIRLLDKELAEVNSGASFLTVSGGSYNVKADPAFMAIPLKSSGYLDTDADGSVFADESQQNQGIRFENVPYLTVKTAYAAGMMHGLGSFDTELSVAGSELQGSVTNKTTFDFQQTYLQLGYQRIELGPLKKGEKKQIRETVQRYYQPPEEAANKPLRSKEEWVAQNKEQVLDIGNNSLQITGVSDSDLEIFQPDYQGVSHHWTVVQQPVELQPNDDERIVYPYGLLEVSVASTEGNFDYTSQNTIALSKGSVTFALHVSQPGLRVKTVEIPLDESPYRIFKKEIFNTKTGKWQEIGRDNGITLTDDLHEYLNTEGNILIRLSNPAEERLILPQPYFQVEGEKTTR
ncbi:hypothetical protein [Brevibacillus fulvus]|uniref:Uncharacterized protein n=1 Tax=Brevibacillus fulvus TaxID=1125967 RepID=A0A938XYE3_9BACL|nr:hypothetical protein [Brevibacillus fulvus]MBM7590469.1 hypothetical protein [Brevibacillus fulvus]